MANHTNVIVTDSSGLPIREFQTNGEDITLTYNATRAEMTATNQHGVSTTYDAAGPLAPQTQGAVTPLTGTTYNGSSYTVDGYDLTNLLSNSTFELNTENITATSMQTEFNNLNSVLKNNIEEYTDTGGSLSGPYVNDGYSTNPAQLIMADCNEYGMNPLVILTQLQKENSLIFASSASVASLAWAMNYGDYVEANSGFGNQITDGTYDLYNIFWNAPSSYPYAMTVNNGVWQYWNGNSYGPTVDVQNAATYAQYVYTPWTLEASSSQPPYGGNLLFAEVWPTVAADFNP